LQKRCLRGYAEKDVHARRVDPAALKELLEGAASDDFSLLVRDVHAESKIAELFLHDQCQIVDWLWEPLLLVHARLLEKRCDELVILLVHAQREIRDEICVDTIQ